MKYSIFLKIKSLRNTQFFKMLEMQSQATLFPHPHPRDLRLWHRLVCLLTGSYLPVKNPSYGPEYNSDASSL